MTSIPFRDIQKVLLSRNPRTIVIFIILLGLAYWFQSGKPGGSSSAVGGGSYSGTCINVIDGDTLDVQTESGKEFRLRLLGVDCMETFNEEKQAEQAARLERSVGEIRLLGEKAREEVRDLVLNMPVTWDVPSGTPERDDYGRVLAYLEIEGRDVGEWLLKEGLAETRRDPHPRLEKYRSVARPLRQ